MGRDGLLTTGRQSIALHAWIWRAYARAALIPLLCVELVFLATYFAAHEWVGARNEAAVGAVVEEELSLLIKSEASVLEEQLTRVRTTATVFGLQARAALEHEATLSPIDAARITERDGALVTTSDTPTGDGAAVFFSGVRPIGAAERLKVARLLTSQSLMRDVQRSDPLIAAIYVNTFDSLNVIFPYFDVESQYPKKMDIPTYNFYYEADAQHNPRRETRWTNVYVDPAGNGWMTSCIAPVYRGDFLEGVVGVDVTVDRIIRHVLELQIPWGGYGMLVDNTGVVMALPPAGEADWGLSELTVHRYDEVIQKDTFKPEQFNLSRHADASIRRIVAEDEGIMRIPFGGRQQAVAWAKVPSTGWKLAVLVPEQRAFEIVHQLNSTIERVGWWMIAGLCIFYGVFFLFLYRRARTMSAALAGPLVELNEMVKRIGAGAFLQPVPQIVVTELQETAEHLQRMGNSLGRSADELRRHVADRSSQLLAALSIVARHDASLEELPVGFEVNHRYRVVRLLGVGAMGAVYEVIRIEDGARFAMKVAVGIAGVAFARLAREAHLLSRIESEHVVKVIDIDVGERGFMFMVLELVEGDTMRRLIQHHHPLPAAVITDILLQVARGVAALHQASIAHRDLKPENVLVNEQDGQRRVKITDFGISRLTERAVTEVAADADADVTRPTSGLLELVEGKTIEVVRTASFRSSRHERSATGAPLSQHLPHVGAALHTGLELTAAGAVAGTPDYIAPELLRGTSTDPLRADIFSFGVLAYELIMNQRPYRFPIEREFSDDELLHLEKPPALRDACAALQTLVMTCLAFAPEQRPTIDEIVTQLQRLAEARP